MMHEQTRAEHSAQRDLVARSMMLADTRSERSEYGKRRPILAPVPPPHVYRLPVVKPL